MTNLATIEMRRSVTAFFNDVFNFLTEYFTAGIWEDMHDIADPELRLRSTNLLQVVHNRWAPNTHAKYDSGWEGWSSWCRRYPESNSLPADPFYIALYLNDLVLENCKDPNERRIWDQICSHNCRLRQPHGTQFSKGCLGRGETLGGEEHGKTPKRTRN